MERGVLVTGGAGYIGSHAVKHLLKEGQRVVVLDNLDRGNRGAVDALKSFAPGGPDQVHFEEMDILETDRLERLLREHRIDSVMHFAALAYVRESVECPERYQRVNVNGMRSLLNAIDAACDSDTRIRNFVFSSSCATYGAPDPSLIPIKEDCPQRPINPYGETKLACERMLLDFQDAREDLSIAVLRYFNVAGSDMEGLLGEHHVPETHIIPLIIQTALGRRASFTIFGTGLPTRDGTCVRDYIHVDDLVDAHSWALQRISAAEDGGSAPATARWIYNLGIGRPYSIREIIKSVERVAGKKIRVVDGPANPADPPVLCADPTAFQTDQGWQPKHTSIDDIVESAFNWMRDHPNGYD